MMITTIVVSGLCIIALVLCQSVWVETTAWKQRASVQSELDKRKLLKMLHKEVVEEAERIVNA